MLKRGIEVLVGAALAVAMLAVLPAVAEAQGEALGMATPQDERGANHGTEAASVVVRPGDSLWSISEEHLGPNATPRRIANTVERIYAINRVRIGADPDLISSGQSLLLPPIVRATPARNAAEPAEASPTGRGLKSKRERASHTTVGEADTKAGRTSEPVALLDMPTKQVTPKVGSLSVTDAPSPLESFERIARTHLLSVTSAIVGLFPQDPLLRRKLFGWGIMALTVLVTGLLAWKLPLERNVGGYGVWGIPRGYVGRYTPRAKATDRYRGTPELAPAPAVAEPEWRGVDGGAPAVENDANSAGIIVAARRRRVRVLRQQAYGSRRSPNGALATGAHNPQVMRLLRRARTFAPGWPLTGSPPLRRGPSPRNEGDYDGSQDDLCGDARTDAADVSLRRREWEAVDPDRKQALVVSRHAVFRECLALVLEWRMDFWIAQAGSLSEARRVLRNAEAEPDLAVVDLELPNGGGIELIGDICEMWPRVSVLALTTRRNLERAAWAKRAGAGEVLYMDASSDELLEEVRRLENS
jgi:ActR/RegA family two-component response regulator/LysM repeat protein